MTDAKNRKRIGSRYLYVSGFDFITPSERWDRAYVLADAVPKLNPIGGGAPLGAKTCDIDFEVAADSGVLMETVMGALIAHLLGESLTVTRAYVSSEGHGYITALSAEAMAPIVDRPTAEASRSHPIRD